MTNSASTHEDISRAHEGKVSSNRSFGIVFSAVFGLIALWPLLNGDAVRFWAVTLSLLFLTLALIVPKWLAPLNRAWALLGSILHKITNPIVLGSLFFVVLVPSGLLMRLAGKDPLRLKFDSEVESYWIAREPGAPAPDSMKNQF
jgi:hypothetical protein